MTRAIRIGAVLAALRAMISCAKANGTASGSTTPPEVSSSMFPPPSGQSPGGLPPAMRPNLAHPDGRATDLRPQRWDRVVPATGNQVQVYYTVSGRPDCATLGRVDVTESARTVAVTLLIGRLPGADCATQPALAAPMMTMVTLTAPLGNRPVHDGAT